MPTQVPAPTLVPNNVDPQAQDPIAVADAAEAAQAAQEETNTAELRRQRLAMFGGIDVVDVTVCVGYRDATGVRHEVVRQVQDSAEFRIVKCAHSTEELMAIKKESGDIIGHEPTGRYKLKVEVDFIRN